MKTDSGNSRQQMLAALCLMSEGQDAEKLFSFLGTQEAAELVKVAGGLSKDGDFEKGNFIRKLRSLAQIQKISSLEDIHPGWIIERLEGESPRLLGILCRSLSGDKTRYLIGHLSAEDKRRLPTLGQSYRVSPEIVQIVRSCLEEKFGLTLPIPQSGPFRFTHLALLTKDDLRTLFWDLGLEEIRKAFYAVDVPALRAFLARFSPQEAKEIRQRIERGGVVSKEEKTQAQSHIVSLPLDQVRAEGLLREVGYSAFARALMEDDKKVAELIWMKLSPEEGYRLKRLAQEQSPVSQGREARQEAVLSRLTILEKKGLIRGYWKE